MDAAKLAGVEAADTDWATLWAEQIRQEVRLQPDRRFSWDQISHLLSTLRSKFSNYAWRNVAKPRIRAYTHPVTGRSRVRLYYLIANDFLGQTIWCADLDPDCQDETDIRNSRLVSLNRIKTCLISPCANGSRAGVSKDEELLQERKRSYTTGITDFDLDAASGTVVFAYQNFICHIVDRIVDSDASGGLATPGDEIDCQLNGFQAPHTPLNLTICPRCPSIAAYAADRSVYCVELNTQQIVLAFTLPEVVGGGSGHISAGLPPFAVQEEFDRFHGFWWRPAASVSPATSPPQDLDLVIEVVDESSVTSISIVDPLKAGLETDSFAYPRAGTPNAVSSLVLVKVFVADDQALTLSAPRHLAGELGSRDPDPEREYLVRVDWSPNGELLLAQTMNRIQDRLRLWAYQPDLDRTLCLMEECAPDGHWVEVHDLLKVLTVSDRDVAFLWASEATGFRHLYHVTADLTLEHSGNNSIATSVRRQLTGGDWQVQTDHLSVDAVHQLAYFNSTALDPRAIQLCRVSYGSNEVARQPAVEILTEAFHQPGSSGLPKTSNGVVFPGEKLALLTVQCSSHSPVTRLCKLSSPAVESSPSSSVSPLPLQSLYSLTTQISCDNFFLEPEYFQFVGPGGQTLYGLLFKPLDYQVGQQYPTVQYVYGGPHVQLVNNTFVGYSFHRVTKACYFGFCVLIVDNRGSDNRGRQFASQVHHRLGSIELPDQVAGLQFAASLFGCIDLNRVGLFGWSYGGYLSLVGMRDFKDVYRLAVSGAPVTEWELYDTAYTERYMGLPDGSGGRYEASSAINGGSGIGAYPSEANRLLIVHGSIDENVHFYHTARLLDRLAGARKPYSLLIYPSERHGLRNTASKEHFEISLMHFLCQNL